MNKIIIKKQGNMKVPVKIFVNDKLCPNKATIERLKEIASLDGIYKSVIALPDLYCKSSRYVPTGIVVPTRKVIFPRFVLTLCGISLMKTSLSTNDLDNKKMNKLFSSFKKKISVKNWDKANITIKELDNILKLGLGWNKNYDKNDILNIEENGSMFKEGPARNIISMLPKDSIKLGLTGVKVLGADNHFIEMQVVDEIINKNIAKKFGLFKNQIVMMVHTDPEQFSKSVYDNLFKTKKKFDLARLYRKYYNKIFLNIKSNFFKKILTSSNKKLNFLYRLLNLKLKSVLSKDELDKVSLNSEIAKRYIALTYALMNYSFVNRMEIQESIKEAFKEINPNIKFRILHDGHHDGVAQEKINGEKLWMHRSGASRAYSSKFFRNHLVFSKTGQPVLIPGSMGHSSYICAATKGCKEAFYSVCHGAGRIYDRPETHGKFSVEGILREMKKKNIKLFRYGAGEIVEEAPLAHKDISEIIKVVDKNKIAEPVVRLRPVAVLKGS